ARQAGRVADRNGGRRRARSEGPNEKARAAPGRFRRSELQDRLRIADRRIRYQRLSGERQQAFDAPRLDHGQREGISPRPNEDRDAAVEDFAEGLGRSARNESLGRARESVRNTGERSADQEQSRTFA